MAAGTGSISTDAIMAGTATQAGTEVTEIRNRLAGYGVSKDNLAALAESMGQNQLSFAQLTALLKHIEQGGSMQKDAMRAAIAAAGN